MENSDVNRRSSSSSDSTTKPVLKKNSSLQNIPLPKYLWIRLALFEKQLAKIIDYLVSNASKYYDKDALVADPDYGNILSSLLVGPCALDYTRTKTSDHFWTDPPADELIQRHRISSVQIMPSSIRRPIPNFKRSLNTSSEDCSSRISSQYIAKDYVESLHQNSRATLLFGKNNVLVLPNKSDCVEPIPGYLSLHQSPNCLIIKWTPNQLMNGFNDDTSDKSKYWDYALQIRVDEIVYVHCHQDNETGGTVILVGQDGVQRPPIHFPRGGHTLAFLSCLETGLLPHGRLDPPLWSQRSGTAKSNKRRRPLPVLQENEDAPKDYVFRIIDNSNHKDILKKHELMDTKTTFPPKVRVQLGSSSTSSDSSTKSFSLDQNAPESPSSVCLQAVCESMKRQIISRAFYGWLAYCRHLSTVRTHLSGLVNNKIVSEKDAEAGISVQKWSELCINGVVNDPIEVYKLTYFGGIAHELRRDVWPYLLGHYKFGTTKEEREELSEQTKQAYENTMSEWLAVEAIVRQRDKESQANAIAKLSSGSASQEAAPEQIGRELSNDVFEDSDSDDEEKIKDEVPEKRTRQNTIKYEDTDDELDQSNPTTESDDRRPSVIHNDIRNISLDSSETQTIISKRLSEENVEREEQDGNHETDEEVINKGANGDTVGNNDEDGNGNKREYTERTEDGGEDHEVTDETRNDGEELKDFIHNVIVTNPSVDISNAQIEKGLQKYMNSLDEEVCGTLVSQDCIDSHGLASPSCLSPASSNGGVYTPELLETFGLNLHRIDKDVQRCDRNYWYFTVTNLEKLRNVMCTYVWEHLDVGYMQGMCDLVAPLLVVFDDESLTYACFCHLMERMVENFPNGNAMDCHFANMRSLIQILDSEMYELMHSHGDYTHFYFCYRWFLLDFKRELLYDDVFAFWETIWAAQHVASTHFVLFLALALLETYRDIILSNSMDFTDIIKFFNEMAERHNAQAILKLARELVLQLQLLIENNCSGIKYVMQN
ncbi:small G protein signaling modulator 2-like [Agrilus planipennis]|uniref:Small G protein signaling modulator 2-like n=1 Tax=Agrilus planipennis TaxID=224129 RepID=A0A7F5RP65_AGRPL|nr:small G protein signaling modulator 2-like [Agrilus planipennis]